MDLPSAGLPGHPDHQVVLESAAEVARGQGPAEQIVLTRLADDARAVSAPQLTPGRCQARTRSVEDSDRPAGVPDGQIGKTIGVEVTAGQSLPERVRAVGPPEVELGPELAPAGHDPRRRPVEDMHHAVPGAQSAEPFRDNQIVRSVRVEVGARSQARLDPLPGRDRLRTGPGRDRRTGARARRLGCADRGLRCRRRVWCYPGR